jgi:hypothetical protein
MVHSAIRACCLGLAVLAAGAATSASAMYNSFTPSLAPMMMQSVVLNPCQPGTPCGDAAKQKYGITPYGVLPRSMEYGSRPSSMPPLRRGGLTRPIDPAATRFTPSPEVTTRTKARFIQMLSSRLPPEQAAKMQQTLGGRDLIAIWAHEMAPQGLHPNDVADAVASYWVLNWIMANHADANDGAARAVSNQIRRVMAVNGRLSSVTDSDRQAVAELLMMQFVTQSALYADAVKAHDEQALSRMGEGAEERFHNEMKIDLRGLKLTPAGFVRKS